MILGNKLSLFVKYARGSIVVPNRAALKEEGIFLGATKVLNIPLKFLSTSECW